MTDQESKSDPQEMKRSTVIMMVAVGLSTMAYSFHLFGGLSDLFGALSAPTVNRRGLSLQVRQTLLSDINAILSVIRSFESTIPEDPAGSFVYLFLVGWMVVISLWGVGFAWIEFKDWVNHDDIQELNNYESGVEQS